MQTEKLYIHDSWCREFQARIMAVSSFRNQPSLILDRSAFYGEAGGQLGDRGWLEHSSGHRYKVIDCQYDDQGRLHHLLAQPATEAVENEQVEGRVEEAHRRDMMSQHTGQHLLSAVFYAELGAETHSARLGSKVGTLDLELTQLEEADLKRVIDRCNDLILQDLPVKALYPDSAGLEAMALRRPPKVTDNIRIIEIGDYDLTPCGGTHCDRTGQIGLLHALGTERYKGKVRVNFLAGKRVLEHLNRREQQVHQAGELLGSGAAGILEAIPKLQSELKARGQALGQVRAAFCRQLANTLLDANPESDRAFTPIIAIRPQDPLESIRQLASYLAARPDVVALVTCKDTEKGKWRVVLERGEKVDLHAGQWFRNKGTQWGGRGGGRPERAEGLFPDDTDWEAITPDLF